MIVELLTEHHLELLSLKGGCRGSSKSTLVKITHCWKPHVVAQLLFYKNALYSCCSILDAVKKRPNTIA